MQTLTLTVAPVLQSICHRERHGGEWGWHFIVLFDDCVDDTGNSEDGDGSSNRRRYNQVADCIWGKYGLPVLGGHGDNHSVKDSDSDDGSGGGGGSDGEMLPMIGIVGTVLYFSWKDISSTTQMSISFVKTRDFWSFSFNLLCKEMWMIVERGYT